jgi:hypothetical protein
LILEALEWAAGLPLAVLGVLLSAVHGAFDSPHFPDEENDILVDLLESNGTPARGEGQWQGWSGVGDPVLALRRRC